MSLISMNMKELFPYCLLIIVKSMVQSQNILDYPFCTINLMNQSNTLSSQRLFWVCIQTLFRLSFPQLLTPPADQSVTKKKWKGMNGREWMDLTVFLPLFTKVKIFPCVLSTRIYRTFTFENSRILRIKYVSRNLLLSFPSTGE